MSKILSILLSSLIVILAAATININAAQARTDSEFLGLSDLSQQPADYGVDVNLGVVPAVSMDIIQDMIQDSGQPGSTGGPDQVMQQLMDYGGSEPEAATCVDVADPNCTVIGDGGGTEDDDDADHRKDADDSDAGNVGTDGDDDDDGDDGDGGDDGHDHDDDDDDDDDDGGGHDHHDGDGRGHGHDYDDD